MSILYGTKSSLCVLDRNDHTLKPEVKTSPRKCSSTCPNAGFYPANSDAEGVRVTDLPVPQEEHRAHPAGSLFCRMEKAPIYPDSGSHHRKNIHSWANPILPLFGSKTSRPAIEQSRFQPTLSTVCLMKPPLSPTDGRAVKVTTR